MKQEKSISQYITEIIILIKRNIFHLVYFVVIGLVIGVVYANWIQDNNYTSSGKLIITQTITDAQRENVVATLRSEEFVQLVATELNTTHATLPNGSALTASYVANGISGTYTTNSPTIVVNFSSPYQALTLETINIILNEFVDYGNTKLTFVNSTIRVSESATEAVSNGYNHFLIYGAAIVLGLVLGGGIVVFTDYKSGKILFATDVEDLGYRVYSLNKVKGDPKKTATKEQLVKNVIQLQNNLESNIRDRFIKTIAFSSFTSTTKNDELIDLVAKTYAENGQRTVIVDLDLANPNLNGKYNFSSKNNIVDFVESEKFELKFDEIQKDLYFISGKEINYPSKFFKSDKFRQVIDEIGKEFEIIIFRLSKVDDDATSLSALDKFDFLVTSVMVDKTSKTKLVNYLESIKKISYENVVINTFE